MSRDVEMTTSQREDRRPFVAVATLVSTKLEHEAHLTWRPVGFKWASRSWKVWLYMCPTLLANAALLVGFWTSTDWDGYLQMPVRWCTLGNITLPFVFVVGPLLIGIYFLLATRGVLEELPRSDIKVGFDVNERLDFLCRETKFWFYEELIAWVLLLMFATMCIYVTTVERTLTFMGGYVPTVTLYGLFVLPAFLVMPVMAHALRFSLARLEGNEMIEYLQELGASGQRAVLVQSICAAFIIVYLMHIPYAYLGDSTDATACSLLNHSYLTARCVSEDFVRDGPLHCSGIPSYGSFNSTVFACASALSFSSAVTMNMCSSGVSIMAFMWYFLLPYRNERLTADTEFPSLLMTGHALLHGSVGCGSIFFISYMMLELPYAHYISPHTLITPRFLTINPAAVALMVLYATTSAAVLCYFFEQVFMHPKRMRKTRKNTEKQQLDLISKEMNMLVDGRPMLIAAGIKKLLAETPAFPASEDKFVAYLQTGKPKEAATGVKKFLDVPVERLQKGTQAIKDEYELHGSEDEKECLQYVLEAKAGSSDKIFDNSKQVRDQSRRGENMYLKDFCNCHQARTAKLKEEEVVALRLYTTMCYRTLNAPLREKQQRQPHPFAATVAFISQAVAKLRAVRAEDDATSEMDLWRGMRDMQVTSDFEKNGGTEFAPMSTTSNPKVAIDYARLGQHTESHALLLKIRPSNFMHCGVDVSFLSCFPDEAEFLYPPLTYLKPTGRRQEVECKGTSFCVLEVEPAFPTD